MANHLYQMIIDHHPSQSDNDVVRNGIINFNDNFLEYKSKSLSVFLKDDEKKIRGGILTWIDLESMYIEILWLEEKLRHQGYGSKLLAIIEKEATEMGCHYVTVDTFAFQAEGFYLKNGYERIGEIKNYIRQYSRIFFKKELKRGVIHE